MNSFVEMREQIRKQVMTSSDAQLEEAMKLALLEVEKTRSIEASQITVYNIIEAEYPKRLAKRNNP